MIRQLVELARATPGMIRARQQIRRCEREGHVYRKRGRDWPFCVRCGTFR